MPAQSKPLLQRAGECCKHWAAIWGLIIMVLGGMMTLYIQGSNISERATKTAAAANEGGDVIVRLIQTNQYVLKSMLSSDKDQLEFQLFQMRLDDPNSIVSDKYKLIQAQAEKIQKDLDRLPTKRVE